MSIEYNIVFFREEEVRVPELCNEPELYLMHPL
jgi:hypothetical protein